jgi:hypothetical protein
VKTHTIGTDSYAIFDKSDKGSLLMLHFIWGKKDFRIFLERKNASSGKGAHQAVLHSKSSGEYLLSRLQYLYEFEWCDYDRVSGHGLSREEVRWQQGSAAHYVELPQHFYEVAVELACREFGLKRKGATAMAV